MLGERGDNYGLRTLVISFLRLDFGSVAGGVIFASLSARLERRLKKRMIKKITAAITRKSTTF